MGSHWRSQMKNSFKIVVVGILAFAICIGSISIGFILSLNNGGKATDANAVLTAHADPLFGLNGNHNFLLAHQLMRIADNGEWQLQNTGSPLNYFALCSMRISNANRGIMPSIQLFQSGGMFPNEGIFRNQRWNLVFVSRAAPNAEPVFTFYMENAYRDGIRTSDTYRLSPARDAIRSDLDMTRSRFSFGGVNGLSDFLVRPNELPGQWQSNQAHSFGINGFTNNFFPNNVIPTDRIAENDFIWLPSQHEIRNTDGIWNLSGQQAVFTGADRAWLRSHRYNDDHEWVHTIHSNSMLSEARMDHITQPTAGLRPAIHLRLSQLASVENMINHFNSVIDDLRTDVSFWTNRSTTLQGHLNQIRTLVPTFTGTDAQLFAFIQNHIQNLENDIANLKLEINKVTQAELSASASVDLYISALDDLNTEIQGIKADKAFLEYLVTLFNGFTPSGNPATAQAEVDAWLDARAAGNTASLISTINAQVSGNVTSVNGLIVYIRNLETTQLNVIGQLNMANQTRANVETQLSSAQTQLAAVRAEKKELEGKLSAIEKLLDNPEDIEIVISDIVTEITRLQAANLKSDSSNNIISENPLFYGLIAGMIALLVGFIIMFIMYKRKEA